MKWLRFGTLSVGSLTTTLLLGVIMIYLLSRRRKPRDACFLTGYITVIFILTLSYTVRYAVFSPLSLATGQVSNLIVFGVVALIQFSYHYGGCRFPRESRIALIISLSAGAILWASLFFTDDLAAVYDFEAQYFTYQFGPRIGIFTLPGFIWASAVFFRNSRAAAGEDKERDARSNRNFALLTLITAVLPLFYLLFQLGIITRTVYNQIFNTGSLLVCVAIFTVYVNNSPLPTSYIIKMTGIPLVIVLSSFGIMSNALMPVIRETVSERYSDDLAQTRFALENGYRSLIPSEALFIVPADEREGAFEYFNEALPDRTAAGIRATVNGTGPFYLDLYNTQSFYLAFTVYSRGTPYIAGFPYQSYRDALHSFIVRIVIIVSLTTLTVIVGFPLFFRFGLLRPLERLLNAVRQVSSGNYRLKLPVQTADELGQLAGGFNSMVDSLKDAEGSFKALTENASDAILIVSAEGRILFANPEAERLSGRPFGKLINLHFSSLIPSELLPVVVKYFSDSSMGETGKKLPSTFETMTVQSSGRLLPVEITAAPTFWQRSHANVVIIRDISERKQAEEALRAQQQQLMKMDKAASIGALVAGVAHEVNNPNQAISMNLGFLTEGLNRLFTLAESGEAADDSTRLAGMPYEEFKQSALDGLQEIGGSTRRIDHIVKELKRLVSGGTKPEYKPVGINDIVRTVVDLSSHMIRRSTNHFSTELCEKLPPVSADRISLEQVVLNLLQNACQALGKPSESIMIKTYALKDSEKVCLEVIDSGHGIKEENIPKLTDSFFTTRGASGGTGLGLSVSARIIREHHGELHFDSSTGRGTSVTVILPAHPE